MNAVAAPSLDPDAPASRDSPSDQGGRSGSAPALGTDDLRDIIESYHAVTERLQESHETLQHEVLRLRRELASADAQLQRSRRLAALGEMAAGIAHEVRNPLAAIGLYAEMITSDAPLLGSTDLAQGVGANAGRITDAVRGLSAVVNDVLSFSRQIEPKTVDVDVRDLLTRVIEAHRPELDQHGVELTVDVSVDVVRGDADLLHQALLNLLRNAVDAMVDKDGTGEQAANASGLGVELQVQADPQGDTAIRITDRGPGIADDAVDRIFNPFFTTRSTGTGLGLAIVHRIIDAHGGSITVHNEPTHRGAVFTLTLPAIEHSSPAAGSETP